MSSMASGFSGGAQSFAEGVLTQRIYGRQAQATEYEAQYAEEQSRLKTKKLLGRERVLYAKAGVDISGDSPLVIMASTASAGEREALTIRRQGAEQAKMLRWYGKVARKAGKMAGQSGGISGMMGGAETGISMYGKFGGGGAGGGGSGYSSGAGMGGAIGGGAGYR